MGPRQETLSGEVGTSCLGVGRLISLEVFRIMVDDLAGKVGRGNGTTEDRPTASSPFSFTSDSGVNIGFGGHGILEDAIFSILVDCWAFSCPVDIPLFKGSELASFLTVGESLAINC